MADIGDTVKNIWIKGMEAIGKRASDIATNTKTRVDEMNMVNRRNEILKDFGTRAYALWQKGEQFPEELTSQLQELSDLDEKLNDLRAERYASVKSENEETPAAEEASAEDEAARKAEENEAVSEVLEVEVTEENVAQDAEPADESDSGEAEADSADPAPKVGEESSVPVILVEKEETVEAASDVHEALNDLFPEIPSAEEAADEMNSALDALENGLKEFSDGLDDKISQLTEQIADSQDN